MHLHSRVRLYLLFGALSSGAVGACAISDNGNDTGESPDSGSPVPVGDDAAVDATTRDAGKPPPPTQDATALDGGQTGDASAPPGDDASGPQGDDAPGDDAGNGDAAPQDDAAPATDAPDESDAPPADGGALDAEAGYAPVGSPCSPESTIQARPCDSCGTEQRVCLSSGDGGSPVWQDWGPCQGEVPDACAPVGSVTTAPCGRCGTQESLCSATCTLNVGQCIEPPDAECYPGSQTFLPGVSCATGGRWATCQTNCSWGALGACTVLDGGPLAPNSLIIPATVGTKASKAFTMPAANPIPVVDGTNSNAPNGCLLLSTATSYDYVQLINNSAKSETVSVWHSQAAGGPAFAAGTVMVAYTAFLPPLAGDTEGRGLCDTYSEGCADTATDPSACKGNFAGLMIGDGNQITVPAHSWVWIYSAAQVAGQSGAYQLSVLTASVQ